MLPRFWKISKGEHHPNDIPQANIERLLADLLHYCHERNTGVDVGSGEYLDFDRMIKDAREMVVKEREALDKKHKD